MSDVHHRNLNDDHNECALDLEPWPCPSARAEAEARETKED